MKELKVCIKNILAIKETSVKINRYELYYSKHAGKYSIIHFTDNGTLKDDYEDFENVDDAIVAFIKRSNPVVKE